MLCSWSMEISGVSASVGEPEVSKALRKRLSGSVIVKFTLGGRSEFAEQQVNVANLAHRSSRFWFALRVLAIAPGTAVPRVRALHYPAFAHGRKPFAVFWPGLHLDSPARALRR